MRSGFRFWLSHLGLLATVGAVTLGCCGLYEKPIKYVNEHVTQPGDIAIVVVESNGMLHPETVLARNKVHLVMWISDGDDLSIELAGAPVQVECAHGLRFGFCYTKQPFDVPSYPAIYKYKGTVTCKGKKKSFDPRLEVLP